MDSTDEDKNSINDLRDSLDAIKWNLKLPTGKLSHITRAENGIKTLLNESSPENKDVVDNKLKEYRLRVDQFVSNCNTQLRACSEAPQEELKKFRDWLSQHINSMDSFIEEITNWLTKTQTVVEDDLKPEHSASQISKKSETTKVSLQLKVAEQKIKIENKNKLMAEKYKLELREMEEKQEYERRQLRYKKMNYELEKKYEEKELEELEEQLSQLELKPSRVSLINKTGGNCDISNIKYLQKAAYSRLPQNEPDIFSGEDITLYRSFILAFETMIEQRCDNYEDLYYYLLRYTTGAANNLVSSCQDTNSKIGYKDARELLHTYYGNEYKLAQEYLDKLAKWEPIKSEDHKSLSKFSAFLSSCHKMINKMDPLNQLNSWRDIQELALKLPYDLRKRFRKKASRMITNSMKVDFGVFVQFVNEEAEIMSLPVLGCIADRGSKTDSLKQRAFYTTERSGSQPDKVSCPCCKKENHTLNDCYFFLRKPINERVEFVKQQKLCFGCLLTNLHWSKNCESHLQCTICKMTHPTSLHRYREKAYDVYNNIVNKEETKHRSTDNEVKIDHEKALSMTTRENCKVVCPAIPVLIKSTDGQKSIHTYIGLDNHSTASYMDNDLKNKLNINGIQTTLSIATLESESTILETEIIKDLVIYSLDESVSITIPKLYSKNNWPFTIDQTPKTEQIKPFIEFKEIPFNLINKKIGILIGLDVPEIIKPLEIISTSKHGPYASRHVLGWTINGPIKGNFSVESCMRTSINDHQELDEKFERIFGKDFEDNNKMTKFSIEEEDWLSDINKKTTKLPTNNFQIKLPFSEENIKMPNNFNQVYSRLMRQKEKFLKDETYYREYEKFMQTMIDRDFVEKIPEDEINSEYGKCWYLAHHGVKHKLKGKLRVVFDCSLEYQGTSLNKKLTTGPDLTNALVGVLLRFRLENVAVCGDVEKMFYMIKLSKEDSNFLRFLWYDDLESKPVQYRLKVHVFGATSSPSVANFALKKSTENVSNNLVKTTILDYFYVDDMMTSFSSEKLAIDVLNDVQNTLKSSGFNLTCISSNSREVLKSVDKSKLSNNLNSVNIDFEDLPYERTLGIKWNPEKDCFGYSLNVVDQAITKRGLLSTIFSIYDPLFLASPAIIRAKRLFQICCHMKLPWDDPLPDNLKYIWINWKKQIKKLESIEIPRCYKSLLSDIKSIQLHIFCDGSEIGYGGVSYLRYEDQRSNVETSIVMAKAKLTPLNRGSLKTVPRIELNSAKLAVALFEKIKGELENHIKIDKVFFWTDSLVTIRYIRSKKGHFQKFVSNRVAYILNSTSIDMWRLVPGDLNPADLLSRGISDVDSFIADENWFKGPFFLKKCEEHWPRSKDVEEVSEDDPELKLKHYTFKTVESSLSHNTMNKLLFSTSNLFKLKCRIAAMIRFKKYLLKKEVKTSRITPDEIDSAEKSLWKYIQILEFPIIYNSLKDTDKLPRRNLINKITPYIDEEGILRSKGRLKHAPLPYDTKFPIILHGNSFPVKLLIQEIHDKCGHLGKQAVFAILREKFYVVKGSKTVKNVLHSCITCRKVQRKPNQQQMANLPPDRVTGDKPPFTNSATDLFGPFYVSRGRGKTQEKRYGIIFTCLTSRAAHIEITPSLDTDSYINAFRRFISRRGTPSLMRSDNGTNLTSSDKELKKAISEWNIQNIDTFCTQRNIEWIFQPPFASNFGGVFEREIRTIRKIFNSLLQDFDNKVKLTDDLLSTLFCEIENILNNRPLTTVTNDSDYIEALTPNHLLRLKGDLFPPGVFNNDDIYAKRKWRQCQFLADLFWRRFYKEYIPLLRYRQKWLHKERSLHPGDIVLVVDNLLPRNLWSLGKVISIKSDDEGDVRSATIEVCKSKHERGVRYSKSVLSRPVNKLVLITCKND